MSKGSSGIDWNYISSVSPNDLIEDKQSMNLVIHNFLNAQNFESVSSATLIHLLNILQVIVKTLLTEQNNIFHQKDNQISKKQKLQSEIQKNYKVKLVNIPEEYQALLDQIPEGILKQIYSKFSFLYFPYSVIEKENKSINIETYLFDFLKNFKFITYHISYYYRNFHKKPSISNINKHEYVTNKNLDLKEGTFHVVDAVFCVENKCIIIEQIDLSKLTKITAKLKEQQISVLDLTKIFNNIQSSTEEEQAKEEISSFSNRFFREISENKFILVTIQSIVGYMIRRYYYNTDYFTDSTFFKYDYDSNVLKQKIQKDLFDIANSKEAENAFNCVKPLVIDVVTDIKDGNKVQYQYFKKEDFIELRNVFANEKAFYKLVIHVQSLYIFLLKKIDSRMSENEMTHEIEFCKNHSHHSFVPFYGFLKENEKIIGFVYEFMSNGSLDKNKEIIDEIYSLMTMNRVFLGINYLHNNNLIHRDLKPSNILLNHDLIPFINDFETIRNLNKNQEKEFTLDFGTELYMSPEQYESGTISYPTDIYSFGLLLYFLMRKRHLKNEENEELEIKKVNPKFIQNLIVSCTNYSLEERPTIQDIGIIIFDEILSFNYYKPFLNFETKINKFIGIQFLYEAFLVYLYFRINVDDSTPFLQFMIIIICRSINETKYLYNYLALIYEGKKGIEVDQDYSKAIEYYKLAIKQNNLDSYVNLGKLYLNGNGVEQNYLEAKKYFEIAAKQGDSEALLNLGNIYCIGQGVEQDYLKAKEYYELAAKKDNSEALLYIGNLYFEGKGVNQDYSKSKHYYELAGKLNNSEALLLLGDIYYNGLGVDQNYTKAREYYESAYNLGYPNASFVLGKLYLYGQGVERSFSKAIEYFESASKDGDSNALFNLGKIYYNGFGVEINYSKAIEYFELSSKFNNLDALIALASFYEYGIGVEKNYTKAKEYFTIASKLGDSRGFYGLGFYYLNGFGVQKNIFKAKDFFEESAKLGNSEAQLVLGNLYFDGQGCNIDYKKAKEYYKSAAKQNNSKAQFMLGNLYYNGYGTKKKLSKALNYFGLSAKQNYPDALLYLGDFYLFGIGVRRDYLKAKYYFYLASKLNDSKGLLKLGCFYMENYKGFKPDFAKARECFELLVNQNNPLALFNLALLYVKGLGVDKDYSKAKKYYEELAKLNDSKAIFNLGNLYFYGQGVKKDLEKAKEYYDKAEELEKPSFIERDHRVSNIFNYYKPNKKNEYIQTIPIIPIIFRKIDENKPRYIYYDGNKMKDYYDTDFESDDEYAIDLENGLFFDEFKQKDCLLKNRYIEILKKEHKYKILGDLYYYGCINNTPDYLKAKEYYESASQIIFPDKNVLISLGDLYRDGLGVEQDYLKARKYYGLALKQNSPTSYLRIGDLYKNGQGVKQNYLKAKKYYEDSCKSYHFVLDSILAVCEALCNLGDLYYNGQGVEQSFIKAKEYYELSMNGNNTQVRNLNKKKYFNYKALLKLGNLYFKGEGVNQDYLKAKEYYEISAELVNSDYFLKLNGFYVKIINYGYNSSQPNPDSDISDTIQQAIEKYNKLMEHKKIELSDLGNSDALLNLGIVYLNGFGIEKDYSKAIQYFELSSNLGNSDSYLYLGNLYYNGEGVKKDYLKAKEFYELSSRLNNSNAHNALGELYLYGNGVDKNHLIAFDYFLLASKQNHPFSLFHLGCIYSNADDLSRAIYYFLRCSKIHSEIMQPENSIVIYRPYNCYRYRSLNELGLIYLIEFHDIDKAVDYIKESAFGEFPFGQNSFALLCQFYLNNNENAEYMFSKASKKNFALAEFNLGFLKEKEGKIKDAFEYYKKASENEKVPLMFHGKKHEDDRLDASKHFVICAANLKLTEYYLSELDFESAKKYFLKSLSNLKQLFEYIQTKINHSNKKFILYSLLNQIQPEDDDEEEEYRNDSDFKMKKMCEDEMLYEKENKNVKSEVIKNNLNFISEDVNKKKKIKINYDPETFFDDMITDSNIKNKFVNEIREIIKDIESVLCTPPYSILFGRISLKKSNQIKEINQSIKNCNEMFYRGFDLDI